MKSEVIAMIFALVVLTSVCFGEENDLPVYSAKSTGSPPVIDGRLDDACWSEAEKTSVFLNVDGSEAKVETRGMVCYGQDKIYIGIECKEPEIKMLKKNLSSGTVQPWEESVEMFFDVNADQRDYMQLRVGILGDKDTSETDIVGMPQLNSKWEGKALVSEDAWSIEAAIPVSVLNGKIDRAKYWGMNLNRARAVGSGGWLCWSATKGWFHIPTRFGKLIFTPYSDWLVDYFSGEIKNRIETIRSLADSYGKITGKMSFEAEMLDQLAKSYVEMVRNSATENSSQCKTMYDKGLAMLEQADEMLAKARLTVIDGEFGQ